MSRMDDALDVLENQHGIFVEYFEEYQEWNWSFTIVPGDTRNLAAKLPSHGFESLGEAVGHACAAVGVNPADPRGELGEVYAGDYDDYYYDELERDHDEMYEPDNHFEGE